MENTNRSGARKRFVTGHHSLPQHFGAATACALNPQRNFRPLIFEKQPANRPIARKIQLELNFLGPFVLASFVCFGAIPGDRDPRFSLLRVRNTLI
jgi:hypothetical protein